MWCGHREAEQLELNAPGRKANMYWIERQTITRRLSKRATKKERYRTSLYELHYCETS